MRLASPWTDHAIVQHSKQIVLWGWCDTPRVRVDATLGSSKATGAAGYDGRFELRLPPLPIGGPLELRVVASSGEECVCRDILVGEVWLISGQSNVEFPLKTFDENDPLAQTDLYLSEGGVDDMLRVFTVPRDGLATTNTRVGGSTPEWKYSNAENAPDFTAVGAWFGLYLRKRLEGIPVGIIHCSWGGTFIWTWMSRSALSSIPSGRELLEIDDPVVRDAEYWDRFPVPYNYNECPDEILQEARRSKKFTYHGYPPFSWYSPHKLYDTMLKTVIPYGIRGFIWYQGAEDADWPKDYLPYYERLVALVKDWRYQWAQGEDFPCICLQLASWCAPDNDGWCTIQDDERKLCLELPNVYSCAINDTNHGEPDNNHQHDKQPIGYRLAQVALGEVYKLQDVTPAGPLLTKVTKEPDGRHLRLHFKYANGLHARDGQPLRTFQVADENGTWHDANATVDGETILLDAPGIQSPVAARYNWQARLPQGNLVNSADFPALTFTQKV